MRGVLSSSAWVALGVLALSGCTIIVGANDDRYTKNHNAADGGMDAAPDGNVPTCADLNCADDQICDEVLVACVGGESCSVDSDCPSDETGCENGTCVLCDADQDGFAHDRTARCANFGGPVDCDDSDPTTYPGAEPVCGNGKIDACPGTGDGLLDFLKQIDPAGTFAEAGRLAPRYIDTASLNVGDRAHVAISLPQANFFPNGEADGYIAWSETLQNERTAILTRFDFDDLQLDYFDLRDLREPNIGLGQIQDVQLSTIGGRPYLGMTAVSSNITTPEGYAGIVSLEAQWNGGGPGHTTQGEAFDQRFRPEGSAHLGYGYSDVNMPQLKFGLPRAPKPSFAFLPAVDPNMSPTIWEEPNTLSPDPSWLVGSGPIAVGPAVTPNAYFTQNDRGMFLNEVQLEVPGMLVGEPAFVWFAELGYGFLFAQAAVGPGQVSPHLFQLFCDGPDAPCGVQEFNAPTIPPLIAPYAEAVSKEMGVLIGGEGLDSQEVVMRFIRSETGEVLPFALPLLNTNQTGLAKLGLESVDVSIQESPQGVTIGVLTGVRFALAAGDGLSNEEYDIWLTGARVCMQQ